MVRRAAVRVKRVTRLAERSAAFALQRIADGLHAPCVMTHGFHGESPASLPAQCFATQVAAVQEHAGREHGSLAMADWNRVPCARWRVDYPKLSKDDMRIKEFSGWRCPCCKEISGVGGAEIVGGDGSHAAVARGSVGWTHFRRSNGGWGTPTSRIDFAVASGAQVGRWSLVEQVAPEWVGGRPLSDHVLCVYSREDLPAPPGLFRPKGVPVCGKQKIRKRTRELFTEKIDAVGAEATWDQVMQESVSAGGTRLGGVVKRTVKEGWAAHAEAKKEQEQRLLLAAGPHGGLAGPKQRYNSWRMRLEEALRFKKAVNAIIEQFT